LIGIGAFPSGGFHSTRTWGLLAQPRSDTRPAGFQCFSRHREEHKQRSNPSLGKRPDGLLRFAKIRRPPEAGGPEIIASIMRRPLIPMTSQITEPSLMFGRFQRLVDSLHMPRLLPRKLLVLNSQ
jgi:hypothetical protein